MSRRSRSRSPIPRRRFREDEDSGYGHGGSSRGHASYSRGKERERDNGYPARDARRRRDEGGAGAGGGGERGDFERSNRRGDAEYSDRPRAAAGRDDDRRAYDERDRERERAKDRDRYDRRDRERDRDRDPRGGGSSYRNRRSASPRSRDSNRPRGEEGRRDGSRSRSPSGGSKSPVDKTKPNFKPSGLLAAETNTVKAVDGTSTVLKYNEPPEARKPVVNWRLYVFKDADQTELLHIHRQSAYLVGRDRLVADISLDHPSCSKQHAAIQYRYIQEKDEFGSSKGVIKPFIIDLESTNGTIVNDQVIPAARYYELKAGDVIKFGLSTREYVLLHDEAS